MKDLLKRDLEIGDFVVARSPFGKNLAIAKIIRFTTKMIRVSFIGISSFPYTTDDNRDYDVIRKSNEVLKVNGEEVTCYLLQMNQNEQ
jgi:hypothetical protein